MAKELELALKSAKKIGHNSEIEFDENKLVVETAHEFNRSEPSEIISNIKTSGVDFAVENLDMLVLNQPIEPMKKFKTDVFNTEVQELERKLELVTKLR